MRTTNVPAVTVGAVAAFRLAFPRTILRFAGGRELRSDTMARGQAVLGGINAMVVGNYLTTLGRPPADDLALLEELAMSVKPLSQTR